MISCDYHGISVWMVCDFRVIFFWESHPKHIGQLISPILVWLATPNHASPAAAICNKLLIIGCSWQYHRCSEDQEIVGIWTPSKHVRWASCTSLSFIHGKKRPLPTWFESLTMTSRASFWKRNLSSERLGDNTNKSRLFLIPRHRREYSYCQRTVLKTDHFVFWLILPAQGWGSCRDCSWHLRITLFIPGIRYKYDLFLLRTQIGIC